MNPLVPLIVSQSGMAERLLPARRPARVVGVINGVVFDVGEVLVDETREYGTWADWLGIPRHTFSAVFGAVIARGGDYRETFHVFDPSFDLDEQRAARAAAGMPESFDENDLYRDVRPTLEALHSAGLWLAVAGNQTVRAGRILRSLELGVDLIVTSDDLGVEKPDPAFFVEIEKLAPFPSHELLYVGDRLDNDVRPAAQRGFRTALVQRGPWGTIQRDDPDVMRLSTVRMDALSELPALVGELNGVAITPAGP